MIQFNHKHFLNIYIKKNNFNVMNETYLTYCYNAFNKLLYYIIY